MRRAWFCLGCVLMLSGCLADDESGDAAKNGDSSDAPAGELQEVGSVSFGGGGLAVLAGTGAVDGSLCGDFEVDFHEELPAFRWELTLTVEGMPFGATVQLDVTWPDGTTETVVSSNEWTGVYDAEDFKEGTILIEAAPADGTTGTWTAEVTATAFAPLAQGSHSAGWSSRQPC